MSSYSGNTRNSNDSVVKHAIIFGVLALFSVVASGLSYASELTDSLQNQEIIVYKSPNCGCCTKWVDHLEENGFEVTVNTVNDTVSIKQRLGVPLNLSSCHTAVVGDYWIEGHVPADLIQKLLAEQPANIKGIAAPGMPQGSPGMEVPNPMEYEVLSVDDEGTVSVYATRMGESIQ